MEHLATQEEQVIPKLPEIGILEKPFWKPDLSNEQYHQARGFLSSSGLKTLLMKSPAHFKHEWLRGSDGEEENEHFRYGTICHMAILEPDKFKSSFVLEPEFVGPTKDGRMSTQSKAAREQKAQWYADLPKDKIVVTAEDRDKITGTINSILNHDKAAKVIKGAQVEMSGFFREPSTGILCRIRPDILHVGKKVLVDLKTTQNASPRIFASQIAKFGYHISLAFYSIGIKEITGSEPDICALLAVEKEAPFVCSLFTVDKQSLQTAKAWVYHGLSILKSCIEKDKWPSYQSGNAEEISIPEWSHLQQLPNYDLED
jgi:hypothetical protein